MQLSNRQIVLSCVALAAGMVMLSFAAVPLYDLFCRVTGFGGTTQQSVTLPEKAIDRKMTVQFNADTMPELPWTFEPLQRNLTLQVGKPQLAFYKVTNTSDRHTIGTSTFNVTPHQAGQYFVKVECFCFEEQPLAPGESLELPVSFYLDPVMQNDDEMDGVTTITLSYTFFPLKKPE